TTEAKLAAHRDDAPRPLTEVRPDVPPGLAAVVARMLDKDPARRYQTPAEVAEALRPLAEPPPPPAIDSIAILPLVNAADPDAEYLSDGITERLISLVSQ